MPEDYDANTGEIVERFYRRSRELNELFSALSKAQSVFPAAEKDGNGNFGKYATLASVFEATKEGRQQNSLAVIQMPGNGSGNHITVTTVLGHSSGQWIESTISIPPGRLDAQGAGSVVSYLRRYSLMAILGIAQEDDDGEAASIRDPMQIKDARERPITRITARVATPRIVAGKDAEPAKDNTGNGSKPKWIVEFLGRPSYEIDPKKAGGWSAWEKAYLTAADHADSWDQLKKLEQDNTGHIGDFRANVREEVAHHFAERIATNERRLAPEPVMAP